MDFRVHVVLGKNPARPYNGIGMSHGYNARFGGLRRLFGADGSERLRLAHVCVIGVGGVGSWAAEALARSGIGQLTMVDFDDVCISNTDRQLQALHGTYGQPKVEVMSQRVRAINPDCQVRALRAFFTTATAGEILATRYDYLVDAIDRISTKCLLIAECRKNGIPIITAGAAGGRRDPTLVRVADMTQASHDRLLQEVRRQLRRKHGFPRGQERFNVPCVYSPEPVVYAHSDGSVCAQPPADADLRLDCDHGFGTAAFVTGTLGFVAAGHVVGAIVGTG